jgi:GNAT superfamily N-acetyltransferase
MSWPAESRENAAMDETVVEGALRIRQMEALGVDEVEALADVLVECVEGGASVGFVLPMTHDKARTFWTRVGETLKRGARRLLLAETAAGEIVGTVQLVEPSSENQPHRADVAKMLVRPSARRRGVGALLLAAVERVAREQGKTLLVLDTATAEADRLYARHGWQLTGEIPDFALFPDGSPCATRIYYKKIG